MYCINSDSCYVCLRVKSRISLQMKNKEYIFKYANNGSLLKQTVPNIRKDINGTKRKAFTFKVDQ